MKGDAMQTELSLSERHIYCKGFSGLARFASPATQMGPVPCFPKPFDERENMLGAGRFPPPPEGQRD
jgi:hypothetical protein